MWAGVSCPRTIGVPSAALAVSAAGLVLCRAEGISWATVKQLIESELKTTQRKPFRKTLSKVFSVSLLSPGCRILISKGLKCLWVIDAWKKLFFSASLELKLLINILLQGLNAEAYCPLRFSSQEPLPIPNLLLCRLNLFLEKQVVLCKSWKSQKSSWHVCRPNSVYTFVKVS